MVVPVPSPSLIEQVAQPDPNVQLAAGGAIKPIVRGLQRKITGALGENIGTLEKARQKSLALSKGEQVEFLQGRTFEEYSGAGSRAYTYRVEDEGVRVWVPFTNEAGQRRNRGKLFKNVSTVDLEKWILTGDEMPGAEAPTGAVQETVLPDEVPKVTAPEEPTGTTLESETPGLEQHVPVGTPTRLIPEGDDPYDRWIDVTDNDALNVALAPEDAALRRQAAAMGADVDQPTQDLWDFNSKTIPDEQGIHERTQALSERYRGKITDETRGVITHEATRRVADLIGASPKKILAVTKALLERQKGHAIQIDGLDMASTMMAARELMVGQMRRLDDLAEAALTGDVDSLAKFRYQLELVANIQRQYKGAQTEVARTLSAMRMPARKLNDPNPFIRGNEGKLHKQDLTRMLEDHGGEDAVREMAKRYLSLDAGPQRNTYTRGLSRWRRVANAAYEAWRHALLTNPISQTKNIVGGIVGVIAPDVELAGAVIIGAARRNLMGSPEAQTAQLSDLQAQIFGQLAALKEATMASGKAFWTRKGTIPGSKLAQEGTQHEGRAPAWSSENFEVGNFWGNVIDISGNMITGGRVAYRTLEAGDTFFKTISARGEMYKQAMVTGRNRGLTGDDLVDYIAEFINDPPAETLSKMETVARYNTLQTRMDKTGKNIQGLASLPFLRYMLPFVSTPYNAAKWAFLDRTPLGIWAGTSADMIAAGGKQADEAIARITMGSLVGASVMGLVMTGQISGGGPADRNLKAALRAEKWQPYSIKVGNKWISYAGLEPFSSTMGMWADISEIFLSTDFDDADYRTLIGAGIGGTIYNISNKTFMQGFANMGKMIADPDYYGVQTVEDLAQSFLPRGVVYLKRLNDPVHRHARRIIEQFQKNIPGLSDKLNPTVSPFGQDIVAGVQVGSGRRNLAAGPDVLSPAYLSEIKKTPLTTELIRIGRAQKKGVPINNYKDEVSFGNIMGDDEPSFSPTIALPDEIRYWLQVRAGKLGVERMELYMGTDEFKDLQKQSLGGVEYATEMLSAKLQYHYRKGKEQARDELQYEHRIYARWVQSHLERLGREEIKKRAEFGQ